MKLVDDCPFLPLLLQSDGCPCYQGKLSFSTTTMKIYKDVFSGDELFSDTYPMKLVDDCIYEVYGKHEVRKLGDVQLEGSNASAEEMDEGTEEASESGVDLVLNHRLVETGFAKKKVVKYLEENNRAGEVDTFKKVVKCLEENNRA